MPSLSFSCDRYLHKNTPSTSISMHQGLRGFKSHHQTSWEYPLEPCSCIVSTKPSIANGIKIACSMYHLDHCPDIPINLLEPYNIFLQMSSRKGSRDCDLTLKVQYLNDDGTYTPSMNFRLAVDRNG